MMDSPQLLELLVAFLGVALLTLFVVGFILRGMYLQEIAFWRRSRNRWKETYTAFGHEGEMLDDVFSRPKPSWQALTVGLNLKRPISFSRYAATEEDI